MWKSERARAKIVYAKVCASVFRFSGMRHACNEHIAAAVIAFARDTFSNINYTASIFIRARDPTVYIINAIAINLNDLYVTALQCN